LQSQLAELLVLLARAEANDSTRLTAALDLINRAETAYRGAGTGVPFSLGYDRAEWLRRLGKTDGMPAKNPPDATATARDFYLSGLMYTQARDYRTAVEMLESAVAREPSHYWSWFALGHAQSGLGRDPQAEGCYHACVALRPDLPMAYYNRGLCRFRMKQYAAAEADLTTVHHLRPDRTEALVNRALTRLELGRPEDAASDVSGAIDLGATQTRLYFIRAVARERAGDKAGAAADRATGLARTPADEASWITRGNARAAAGDVAGAVADFDAALALNPWSFEALQNKASVLDVANRPADAIAVLGRAVELYPDNPVPRAGRAVLLARKGDRAAAHADAEHCLSRGPDREIVYQLAGVYALTSRTHSEDARTAYRLLADALRLGYGIDLIDGDRDLDPVRGLPEFRQVVDAARKADSERRQR
jgi:tetratricopeptide (TPR) repeat protein